MIQTYVAYGYRLGGPSNWAFKGMAPSDRLITPWYDETDPTHDLAARATDELVNGFLNRRPNAQHRAAYEAQTPTMFDTAIEVSPPDWTREASGEPTLGRHLAPSSPLLDLDRPTPGLYVLVVNDSVRHLDAEEDARYDESEDDEPFEIGDLRIDWDSLLDAALTEVGLQMPCMPDWFWYRTSFAD
ncbi:hypothetical protein Ato02nite_075020 [Paractinoplanes toevensis]|uniref:Uncharacterized protein n=1 Tax=Paractinoplanes toevensis TaxID=571911 RepID=A0A919TGQ1_9ACTN|nr:hypothetical protein Ato02nite_075020 [Actinoplanes toevensis]